MQWLTYLIRTPLGRAALCLLALLGGASSRAGSCVGAACVVAGPRLLSVDSGRSVILNTLIEGLLGGGNLSATALDWNAVAQADVRLDTFLNLLQARVSAASVQDALNTQITAATLFEVAAQAAQADGNVAAASALNLLAARVGGLSGTLRLGDLLQLSFPPGAFTDARLNLLNLVLGGAQLFNTRNAVTTGTTPITLTGVSVDLRTLGLGLDTVTPTVQAFVQVIEPPVYVCGPQGAEFHTAAVRLKLNVNLGNLNVGVPATGLTLTLTRLNLYLEVAQAAGTIGLIDAVADAVTLSATPGVAKLGLGTIPDATFFNRTVADPFTALTPAIIGTTQISVSVPLGRDVNVNLDVNARGLASGTPGPGSLTFSGPYPQTQTVSSGAVGVTSLVTSLVDSLTLSLTVSAGQTLLSPVLTLVNVAISNVLAPVTSTLKLVLRPVLVAVLNAAVDQVLTLLGIRIGEAVLTVTGVNTVCTVTGRVYSDQQPDGTPNPGETWPGPTVTVNALRGGRVVGTVSVPAGSGAYSLSVPENTGALLLSTSPTSLTPTAPGGFVFVNPPTGQVTLSVPPGATSVPDQNFGLFAGDRLTTLVFRDDGRDAVINGVPVSGVPHDVLRQLSELPVAGLTLTAQGSGGSGGTRSATTDQTGAATLYLPLGWTGVTLSAGIVPARDALTGLRVDSAVILATDPLGSGLSPAPLPTPAGTVRAAQLGLTGRPALTPNTAASTEAPATLTYTHQLEPGTLGTLTLSAAGPYPVSVAVDRDCDGTISAAERSAGPTLTVDGSWPRDASGRLRACAAETTVTVPATAAPGTSGVTTTTAALSWALRPVTDSAQATDTTTVIPGATLGKTVQNLTRQEGPAPSVDARPLDTLRYCLNVQNTAPNPITGAVISDTVPGPTQYVSGSLTLNGLPVSDAADTDAAEITAGTVTYRLGTLLPGATARACFDVTVP